MLVFTGVCLLLCSAVITVFGYTWFAPIRYFLITASTAIAGIAALAVAASSTVRRASRQVFILYAQPDREKAVAIGEVLAQSQYRPWIMHKEILPGQIRKDEARRAFDSSSSVVAVISEHTPTDEFVMKALAHLAGARRSGAGRYVAVVPVLVGGAQLPDELIEIQSLEFEGEDWSKQLVKGLNHVTQAGRYNPLRWVRSPDETPDR